MISGIDNERSKLKLLDEARRRVADQARRVAAFDNKLSFSEPLWEMLLSLFIAKLEGVSTPLTELCENIHAVGPETAIRCVGVLENKGLIERFILASRTESAFVRLTPTASELMADSLVQSAAAGRPT